MSAEIFAGPLDREWQKDSPDVSLFWLGQAGFAVKVGPLRFLIDPYLSDSLARKYTGTALPHERMMAAPIRPEQLGPINYVFCTHRHGDHMDPETISALAERNSDLRVIVPTPEMGHAASLNIPKNCLLGAEADTLMSLDGGLSINPLPSAHEEFRTDENGAHHFLGYVFQIGGLAVYHSGDTIPYDGLRERLERKKIALALLPVNGRDPMRRRHGIPGNFHLQEAIQLCIDCKIMAMIGHHFGMFEFNTVLPELIDKAGAEQSDVTVMRAQLKVRYGLGVPCARESNHNHFFRLK
ncbi:MAG: MBL fold metallo-hydrolase [Verrucomicrobia bacterium]|nr:MBL fold metallo-hydrolase [Verrucomicrobiota bacterium]